MCSFSTLTRQQIHSHKQTTSVCNCNLDFSLSSALRSALRSSRNVKHFSDVQTIFILLRFIIEFIYFAISHYSAVDNKKVKAGNKNLNCPKRVKIQKIRNRSGPALSNTTFNMYLSLDDDMEIKRLFMLYSNQTNNLYTRCVACWLPHTLPKRLLW